MLLWKGGDRMKTLQDPQQILRLEALYPPGRYFTPGLCPYHYRVYDKGELLQAPGSSGQHLHIILSGSIQIYSLSAAGEKAPISTVGPGLTLGEVELCGQLVPFYAEAVRRLECLTLSAADCRQYLRDDPVFLRFLARVLAEKLAFVSNLDHSVKDMDQRVLLYLRTLPGHRIDRVGDAIYDLRCSRSSLQRSLARLCRSGKLEKLGKGVYRLAPSLPPAAPDGRP